MQSYPSPQPRPRKPKPVTTDARDSNLIRASVLDVALELGVAHNSTVASWIFNSPLEEACEEPEDTGIPGLTSGSGDTSEESHPLTPPQQSACAIIHSPVTESPSTAFIHFDQILPKSQPPSSRPPILSKPRETPERIPALSVDASGGVSATSDGKSSKERSNRKSDGSGETELESDGNYLSEGAGLSKKAKKKRKDREKSHSGATTDGEDGDYVSDGGYISTSSKSSKTKTKNKAASFFRRKLKLKSHGSDDEDEDTVPPVPPVPSHGLLSRSLSGKLASESSLGSPRNRGFPPSSAPSTPSWDKDGMDIRNVSSLTKSALRSSKREFEPLALSFEPSSAGIDVTLKPTTEPTENGKPNAPAPVIVVLPLRLSTKNSSLPPPPYFNPSPATSHLAVSPSLSFPNTVCDLSRTTTPAVPSGVSSTANDSTKKLLSPPSKRVSPMVSPRLHSSIPPPAPPPNQPLPKVPSPSTSPSAPPQRALPKLPDLPANPSPATLKVHSAPAYSIPSSPMPFIRRGLPSRPVLGRAESEIQIPHSAKPDMQTIPGLDRHSHLDTPGGRSRFGGELPGGGFQPRGIHLAVSELRRQQSDQALGLRGMGRVNMRIQGSTAAIQARPSSNQLPSSPPATVSKFHEHFSSVSTIPLVYPASPPIPHSESTNSDRQSSVSSLQSSGQAFARSSDNDGEADVEDDDESFYPSDEKTAGRKTMYFVENGGHPDLDNFDYNILQQAMEHKPPIHCTSQRPGYF